MEDPGARRHFASVETIRGIGEDETCALYHTAAAWSVGFSAFRCRTHLDPFSVFIQVVSARAPNPVVSRVVPPEPYRRYCEHRHPACFPGAGYVRRDR